MRTEKIAAPRARERARHRPAGQLSWLRDELAGLVAPALWAALAALLLIFLLAPQLPLRYGFDVGYEEGLGSDLPYLRGFNTAERDELGTYRWSDDGATIRVPGVGARELLVSLDWLPTPAAVFEAGPKRYELFAGGSSLGVLPLRAEGGRQLVTVPASAVASGSLELMIRTATITLPGDPRNLGARLSGVEIVRLSAPGLVAPDWPATLAWLGAVALGWMAIRHALGPAERQTTDEGRQNAVSAIDGRRRRWWLAGSASRQLRYRRSSAIALAVGGLLVAAAALLDPPRWAFGAAAALIACALAYGLAILTRAGLPLFARQLGAPLDPWVLGWLCLFVVISFAVRFGGRMYPDSMHGDIGFHHNRFNEAAWGLIYIVSVNRGVDFPYPPGPYMVVAPLTLVGLAPRIVLQLCAALADALSAALVYAIAARVAGPRTALLAAGIYVFTAATFMAAWWSFDTHIYTQFFHLLLMTALCWAVAAWQGDREAGRPVDSGGPLSSVNAPQLLVSSASGARRASWIIAVLLSMVFLGHFGFLINTVLMLGLVAAGVWVASWRGAAWARVLRWPLSMVLAGAGLGAVLFFYSAYIPMFLGQLETAREGGLTAVAGRGPVSRTVMWQRLWRDGLVIHFGLFPLLLLPWGLWQLWRDGRGEQGLGPRRAVAWFMLASLAVALVFAAFPFVAGVTNSPRWMLFIAWAVAVGAAVAVERLWRRGWWGRLATLAMGALVLANTAWIWVGPMLWRIRPPEPF